MARKLPKEAEPFKFKPGVSGNPAGRPKLSPEKKRFRKLTIETYRRVIKIALRGSFEELEAFAKDKRNSALEVGVARLLIRAINEGDTNTFETFTARIVGKIPEVFQVDSNIQSTSKVLASLSVDTAKALIEKCRNKT